MVNRPAIKRYITSSQGDLLTTWLSIEQAVANQIQDLKNHLAKDKIQTPLSLDRAQYHACFSHVIVTALRLAYSNYTNTEKPLKPCIGVFSTTTSLPCTYRINNIRAQGMSLMPSDFHPH